MKPTILAKTLPHGEHVVHLMEDHPKPENRIYRFRDSRGNQVGILGSEFDSLVQWWGEERSRKGVQEPEDV
jgi:hypothetical protein